MRTLERERRFASVLFQSASNGYFYFRVLPYSFTDQTASTADITLKSIIIGGLMANARVYDGTTDATVDLKDVTFNGIVAGDSVTIMNTTGQFTDKNVGNGKTVTLSGAVYGGTDIGNYSITDQAAALANITSRSIIVGGLAAVNRVYDGTTVATIDHSGVTFDGMVVGDNITVGNAMGQFTDKNVGNGKTVTLSGPTYGGVDVGNYSFADQTTSTADITPKSIAVIGIAASDKAYSGNTIAAINMGTVNFEGMISGDDLSISTTGIFDSKNVGINKLITLNSTYSGLDTENYTFSDQQSTLASISRLASVLWIGGSSGDWSNPANWAGGAIPDIANVANIHIPDGVTPTFDDSVSGPVDIDSLTGGSLQFNSGTLNVAHTILLDHFTQDGGVFNGGGNFLANHAIINDATLNIRGNGGLRTFTQNSGMVGIDGNLDITDFEKNGGGLRIGGSLDVTNSFYQSVPRGIDVTGEVRIAHNDTSLIADNLPGHYVTMNDIVKPGPDAGKQTTSVTPSSASDSTQHPNIRYIEAQAAFLRNIVERLGPNWLQTVASWISGPIQVASISKTGSDSVAEESDTGRVDTPNSATTQEAADATKDVPQ